MFRLCASNPIANRLHLIAGAMIMAMHTPANACPFQQKFQFEDIQYADAVLIGEVVDYQYQPRASLLTIETHRNIPSSKFPLMESLGRFQEVQVSWPNSTFARPKTFYRRKMIVALQRAERIDNRLGGVSAETMEQFSGVEYSILQRDCSRPFLFPYTELSHREVADFLDGGSTPYFDFHNPLWGYDMQIERKSLIAKVLGMVAFLLLCAVGLQSWRIRQLKKLRQKSTNREDA